MLTVFISLLILKQISVAVRYFGGHRDR